MNEHPIDQVDPSDEAILASVRRHMSGVETLLPPPRAWNETGVPFRSPVRTAVRSSFGLPGLASVLVVIAVVVVGLGYGLVGRPSASKALSIGRVPSGPVTTITYKLVPRNGGEPAAAELETTVRTLALRLGVIFATELVADPSGALVPDLSRAVGYSVTGEPPDLVVVRFETEYRLDTGFFVWDAAAIRTWLGGTGEIEFVDLPPAVYGTGGAPGPKPLPQVGAAVDPTLPAILTGADIASFSGGVSSDYVNPDVVTTRFDFTGSGAEAMASYSEGNTGHYLAVTLNGRVLCTIVMAGQGRFGTLQTTAISLEDFAIVGWLFQVGMPPLPIPLSEIEFATATAPPGWVAPTPPATRILSPTPVPPTPPLSSEKPTN